MSLLPARWRVQKCYYGEQRVWISFDLKLCDLAFFHLNGRFICM